MKHPWIQYLIAFSLLIVFIVLIVLGVKAGDMTQARIESSTL